MTTMTLHAVLPLDTSRTRHPAAMHVTGSSREARLELDGDLASPDLAHDMLRQLRMVQRRLPVATEVVHLDLSGLDHITIEVAALLCLQRRLLAARGIRLGSVKRGLPSTESAKRVLETLTCPCIADPTEDQSR